MKRSKRYLDMTAVQLIILGCLFLVACGALGAGLFFVSVSGNEGLLLFWQPTSTAMLFLTPTPYLTVTSTLKPTVTLIPYEQLNPSGWVRYTTSSFEI